MPLADRSTSLDTAVTDSQAALDTMESEAAAYFADRSAAQAKEALNPVSEAVERAVTEPKAPAKAAAAKEAPAKDAKPSEAPKGKVSGPPTLKKVEARVEEASEAKSDAKSDPALPDISDIPVQYKPGEMRGKNWDRLKGALDEHRTLAAARGQELETLRAEMESLRAAAKSATSEEAQARLTALQNERDALRSQLQAVAGERIFDTESKPRRDAALAQAKQVAGPEHAARVESLLALGESSYRDNALEELIATLPPLRAAKLTQAVADLDRLSAERAAAAAQGGEIWQRRMNEANAAQERAAQERATRATATFDAALKEWEPVGLTPEEIATARGVYTGKDATLQDASNAALWGAIGPRVASQLNEALARNAELEGELAKLRGAQPGVGAAAAGALPATSDDDDDPTATGYAERIARQALKAGVRFGQ